MKFIAFEINFFYFRSEKKELKFHSFFSWFFKNKKRPFKLLRIDSEVPCEIFYADKRNSAMWNRVFCSRFYFYFYIIYCTQSEKRPEDHGSLIETAFTPLFLFSAQKILTDWYAARGLKDAFDWKKNDTFISPFYPFPLFFALHAHRGISKLDTKRSKLF